MRNLTEMNYSDINKLLNKLNKQIVTLQRKVKQGESLPIDSGINQRELLITFAQSLFGEGILHRDKAEKIADSFINKSVVKNPDCSCEKVDGRCCNILCQNFYPQ